MTRWPSTKPTESAILQAVIKRLYHSREVEVWRNNTGGARPDDTKALNAVVGMAKRGASDAAIGAYVREYLRRRGQKVRFGIPGEPDLTGRYTQHSRHVPPGTRLDVEVKTKDGKLTKEQRAYIENARGDNAIACVVRDVYDCGPVVGGAVEDLW